MNALGGPMRESCVVGQAASKLLSTAGILSFNNDDWADAEAYEHDEHAVPRGLGECCSETCGPNIVVTYAVG